MHQQIQYVSFWKSWYLYIFFWAAAVLVYGAGILLYFKYHKRLHAFIAKRRALRGGRRELFGQPECQDGQCQECEYPASLPDAFVPAPILKAPEAVPTPVAPEPKTEPVTAPTVAASSVDVSVVNVMVAPAKKRSHHKKACTGSGKCSKRR